MLIIIIWYQNFKTNFKLVNWTRKTSTLHLHIVADLFIIQINWESFILKSKMSVFALKKTLRTHVILLEKIYLFKFSTFKEKFSWSCNCWNAIYWTNDRESAIAIPHFYFNNDKWFTSNNLYPLGPSLYNLFSYTFYILSADQ